MPSGVPRQMLPLSRLRAVLAVGPLALTLLAIQPGTLAASCAAPPPLEVTVPGAEIVFVGTVTSVTNGNVWAEVTVEEVWRGPDQPALVLVKGGTGAGAVSSIDRTFETGVKYLFVPSLDPGAGLLDNICSATTPWSEELIKLRPADVRAPLIDAAATPGFDLGGLLGPAGVALVVAFALLGIGLLARGKQDA